MVGYSPKATHTPTIWKVSAAGRSGRRDRGSYLLGNVFQMLADQVVAGGVEQNGKTPGVSEDDQMGLTGEKLDIENTK